MFQLVSTRQFTLPADDSRAVGFSVWQSSTGCPALPLVQELAAATDSAQRCGAYYVPRQARQAVGGTEACP